MQKISSLGKFVDKLLECGNIITPPMSSADLDNCLRVPIIGLEVFRRTIRNEQFSGNLQPYDAIFRALLESPLCPQTTITLVSHFMNNPKVLSRYDEIDLLLYRFQGIVDRVAVIIPEKMHRNIINALISIWTTSIDATIIKTSLFITSMILANFNFRKANNIAINSTLQQSITELFRAISKSNVSERIRERVMISLARNIAYIANNVLSPEDILQLSQEILKQNNNYITSLAAAFLLAKNNNYEQLTTELSKIADYRLYGCTSYYAAAYSGLSEVVREVIDNPNVKIDRIPPIISEFIAIIEQCVEDLYISYDRESNAEYFKVLSKAIFASQYKTEIAEIIIDRLARTKNIIPLNELWKYIAHGIHHNQETKIEILKRTKPKIEKIKNRNVYETIRALCMLHNIY